MFETKRRNLLFCLFITVLLSVSIVFAQETTGGIQGTVKDPRGAVVVKAAVELTSPAQIGVKKIETDTAGYYRFANLPPGVYTLTIKATGFATIKRDGIDISAGRFPSLDIELKVGGAETVVEVTGEAPLIDVTESKVQTSLSAVVLAEVPKGRSFQSVIQMAPGARYEPLQSTTANGRTYNGYQIDGASNGENSYLIEGQETSDVKSGQTKTNAPFEFIDEVQIKTSGFEAQFGGAMGGVVNVIQKRGSNAFHGEFTSYFQGSMLDAGPNVTYRKDPLASVPTGSPNDAAVQVYRTKQDNYRYTDIGFVTSGPLVKDRVWFAAGTVPQFESITRKVDWAYTPTSGSPVKGPQAFKQNFKTYYSYARLDGQAAKNVRLYASWQYNYQTADGAISTGSNLPTADDSTGLYNASARQNPFTYNGSAGYKAPNYIWNFGSDITLTPSLVATTRFGIFHNDLQDRNLPVGQNMYYRDSNYSYPGVSATNAVSLAGTALSTISNGAFALPSAYQSVGANLTQLYDKTDRISFNQDLAWFKNGWAGTHNFKIGYAFNRLSNDVNIGYNDSQAYLAYGTSYYGLESSYANCQAITATNLLNGWTGANGLGGGDATNSGAKCAGLWGSINFREYGTIGKVNSFNHALYIQDAWTIRPGLTVNLGLRTDRENIPSFASGPGFEGIKFPFSQKLAPRIGASWDVLRSGKLKIYGSYGKFYDIMKYELARGSFGGDYWHDCVYALDQPNWSYYTISRGSDGHFCPTTGGANVAYTGPALTGTPTANGLRFIENQDYRMPSNDPTNYLVDRNLKPMSQHEYVVGADFALNKTMGLEARYSRKRLDRIIEDAGILTGGGEQFYIVNPGEGINKNIEGCDTCAPNIKPTRDYDGVELRFIKKPGADRWFSQLSYTYSRLYGNYAGLTSTDLADGNGGRSDPNVTRAFDEPFMQYDANGKNSSGLLATDRPHTFKAFLGYSFRWFGMNSDLSWGQIAYSGTPMSSYLSVDGAPVYVEGRAHWLDITGTSGNWTVSDTSNRRTPVLSQSDINFQHSLHPSKSNEALKLTFGVNVTNLFDQRAVTEYTSNMIRTGKVVVNDYATSTSGYNWLGLANSGTLIKNSLYGTPYAFQNGRTVRMNLKFSF